MIVHSLILLHRFREPKLIIKGISILPLFLKPKLGSTLELDLVHLNLPSDIKIQNIPHKKAYSHNSRLMIIQSSGLLRQSDPKQDMLYQTTSRVHPSVSTRCLCILPPLFLSNSNLITFSRMGHHINFSTGLTLQLLIKGRIFKKSKIKSKNARED